MKSLKKIVNSDAAYEILDSSNCAGSTWTEGGCAILAQALNKLKGYPIYVIYNTKIKSSEHFGAMTPEGNILDADGKHKNAEEWLEFFKENEMPRGGELMVIPFDSGVDMEGIHFDDDASDKLAELIRNQNMIREFVRDVLKESLNNKGEFRKVRVTDLMVDESNMDAAYYRAQDSMGEPTSESSSLPISVNELRDGTLILSDGHHRIADKIIEIENIEDVLNLEFDAEIHKLNYDNIDDIPDERFDEWGDFFNWLINTGDWGLEESEKIEKMAKGILKEGFDSEYKSWKRKNVTIRGIKEAGEENNAGAMLGRGLYTAFLSNKSLAKEYGDVYFVVGAIPKNPKVFNTLNEWEIWFYNTLVYQFSKAKGKEFPDKRDFNASTTIEDELQKLGYDGIVIKGREMVNFKPEDVLYFKDENQLFNYYDYSVRLSESTDVLEENPQLADKVYFKPGKLSPRVREIIIDKITGGDPYTKIITDIYYAILQDSHAVGDWAVRSIDDPNAEIDRTEKKTENDVLSVEEWKRVKSYYQQLKTYNKNVFPIKGYNPNGVQDIWDLIRALNERAKILEDIKKLPAVAIRNMRGDFRQERNSSDLQAYRNGFEYFLAFYSMLGNRDARLRKTIENKMFVANVTLKDLLRFVEEKENLVGGAKFTKNSIKKLVKENDYGMEIVYDSGNAMVVDVTSPDSIKKIGCNSLWCFTYGKGFDSAWRDWNNYSTNDHVYVIIDFSEQPDSPEFMHVLIKPLDYKIEPDEDDDDVNGHKLFNMANEESYNAIGIVNSLVGEQAPFIMNFDEPVDMEGPSSKYPYEDPNQLKLDLQEVRKVVRGVLSEIDYSDDVNDYISKQDMSVNQVSIDLLRPIIRFDDEKYYYDRFIGGIDKPLIVTKHSNHIIDGNHRWKYAKDNNIEKVPVVFVEEIPMHIRKLVINKLSSLIGVHKTISESINSGSERGFLDWLSMKLGKKIGERLGGGQAGEVFEMSHLVIKISSDEMFDSTAVMNKNISGIAKTYAHGKIRVPAKLLKKGFGGNYVDFGESAIGVDRDGILYYIIMEKIKTSFEIENEVDDVSWAFEEFLKDEGKFDGLPPLRILFEERENMQLLWKFVDYIKEEIPNPNAVTETLAEVLVVLRNVGEYYDWMDIHAAQFGRNSKGELVAFDLDNPHDGTDDFDKNVIRENSLGDRYALVYYGEDSEIEEFGVDEYEAADKAEEIAKDGGVRILRDKELTAILLDVEQSRVIGGLWISHDNEKFSFDIAIDSGYQNMGLSSKLIEAAIQEYNVQKEDYDESGDSFKMEVDVINPKLAKILQSKYGFNVVGHLSQDRVLMSIDENLY